MIEKIELYLISPDLYINELGMNMLKINYSKHHALSEELKKHSISFKDKFPDVYSDYLELTLLYTKYLN